MILAKAGSHGNCEGHVGHDGEDFVVGWLLVGQKVRELVLCAHEVLVARAADDPGDEEEGHKRSVADKVGHGHVQQADKDDLRDGRVLHHVEHTMDRPHLIRRPVVVAIQLANLITVFCQDFPPPLAVWLAPLGPMESVLGCQFRNHRGHGGVEVYVM